VIIASTSTRGLCSTFNEIGSSPEAVSPIAQTVVKKHVQKMALTRTRLFFISLVHKKTGVAVQNPGSHVQIPDQFIDSKFNYL
jgi:hypothetical protein